MNALLIAASPSPRSRSAALLDGAAGALEHAGVTVRRLVLNELPAEALLRARTAEPLLRDALDHSLRPVLDNLGAHQVVPSVYALESQVVLSSGSEAVQFDADVRRRLDIGAARLANALESQAHLRQRDERMRLSVVRCSA